MEEKLLIQSKIQWNSSKIKVMCHFPDCDLSNFRLKSSIEVIFKTCSKQIKSLLNKIKNAQLWRILPTVRGRLAQMENTCFINFCLNRTGLNSTHTRIFCAEYVSILMRDPTLNLRKMWPSTQPTEQKTVLKKFLSVWKGT